MPLPTIDQIGEAIKKSLNKSFNEKRQSNPFRLSAIGKPVCQLLAERDGMAKEPEAYNQKIRMLYGDLIEAMFMGLMRTASMPIEIEQGQVTLDVPVVVDGNHTFKSCNGTFDIQMDDQIWDVKSASPYSYKYKFKNFETLYADDSFGYVGQLYSYAMAAGKRAGGWIVIDKSSGEFKVVTTPDNDEDHDRVALEIWDRICGNVQRLHAPGFVRSFEDEAETFNRKLTGNRVLRKGCTMCDYRYSCWPSVKLKEVMDSKAKNKEWVYYTFLGERNAE